ncbi:hypothetical protein OCU04_003748 [Sclerotinia nivalis]|uniref:Uncharacterized protein n=1 Tax=Sclerotinia nivalis TaxID=352851 RepID=A0A9X0DPL5_9HELO|nr:hypothetical protein OCU04_003748 [Sclerotinia nivalis]
MTSRFIAGGKGGANSLRFGCITFEGFQFRGIRKTEASGLDSSSQYQLSNNNHDLAWNSQY